MLSSKVVIVTGASENHSRSLFQFLSTVNFNAFDCVVYDLGLHKDSLTIIQQTYPRALYVRFDYSKYPYYYNIAVNAGEYAWKPAIIYEVLTHIKTNMCPTEILIWCDAGNKFKNLGLTTLVNTIYQTNIYSPISVDPLRTWTHPATCAWFGIDIHSQFSDLINRNGAVLGFNISDLTVQSFIEEFAKCASIKECIAPEGSSRGNHRQDQAVFTVLYYQFKIRHSQQIQPICDMYLDVSIHNDIG